MSSTQEGSVVEISTPKMSGRDIQEIFGGIQLRGMLCCFEGFIGLSYKGGFLASLPLQRVFREQLLKC